MPAGKKEYYEQLHAYALGCLDKTDLVNLRTYIHSGEDYNWQELGEYQNLVALLPSILNIETPEPQLKDKVARKLYRIRDEVRAKRSSDLSSLRTVQNVSTPVSAPKEELNHEVDQHENEPPAEEHFNEIPSQKENALEEQKNKILRKSITGEKGITSKAREFEIVTSVRKTSEFFRPPAEAQVKEPAAKDIPPVQIMPQKEPEVIKEEDIYIKNTPVFDEPVVEQDHEIIDRGRYWKDYSEKVPSSVKPPKKAKSPLFVNLLVIILTVVVAAVVYAYLNLSSEVKTYKGEIENLNREIKNLSVATSQTEEMQSMLELPGTKIINLSGVQSNVFGKVILNLDEGRGFLQLGNMPPLPEEKAYQLWISSSGNNLISLGLFRPAGSTEFFPFDLPEIEEQANIILLTEEPAAGSEKPGNNVYLTGLL